MWFIVCLGARENLNQFTVRFRIDFLAFSMRVTAKPAAMLVNMPEKFLFTRAECMCPLITSLQS